MERKMNKTGYILKQQQGFEGDIITKLITICINVTVHNLFNKKKELDPTFYKVVSTYPSKACYNWVNMIYSLNFIS